MTRHASWAPGLLLLALAGAGAAAQEGPSAAAVARDDPARAPTAGAAATDTAAQVPPVPVTGGGPQLLTEDLRTGTGERARYGMTIVVHYTGWLHEPTALGYRGRKFDSSRDRGQPFTFRLGEGRVIKGWEVGILGMQVGGLRRLVIPPEMAYGSRGVGNGLIPPNSTLVFDVELLGVESSTLIENAK